MLLILLTGNYNFFNILTIFLCLSLVDDDWLLGWSACKASQTGIITSLYVLTDAYIKAKGPDNYILLLTG